MLSQKKKKQNRNPLARQQRGLGNAVSSPSGVCGKAQLLNDIAVL